MSSAWHVSASWKQFGSYMLLVYIYSIEHPLSTHTLLAEQIKNIRILLHSVEIYEYCQAKTL